MLDDAASRGTPPAIEARGLQKHFPLGRGRVVRAVDGVSFALPPGATMGVVGESGCGKSTMARLLLGLHRLDSGTLAVGGLTLGRDCDLKALRRQVQMVFQDSYSSLNPRMTILETLVYNARVQGQRRTEAEERARALLARVGLPPERFALSYPSELSGGQRQRVNIARALITQPRIVVLDEAVSALDKSVEAQVLNLLADLREELGLTYIFISHDLNVVRFISDTVLVMYLGEVVEIAPSEALFGPRTHPYTRALVGSMPSMDPDALRLFPPVTGDPPSPIDPPAGCRFHPRCSHCAPVCSARKPAFSAVDGDGVHRIACHMYDPQSGHPAAAAAGAAA